MHPYRLAAAMSVGPATEAPAREVPVTNPATGEVIATVPELVSQEVHGMVAVGRDPETSVANPIGELHDTPGVWIGDASAFPTASGVNPMVTIMALAHRTAAAIAAS
jgi:choline dehydrogenase-like flavoprotein